MMKKIGVLVMCLLIAFAFASVTHVDAAQTSKIIIDSNGNITPATAFIHRDGGIYTLTADLSRTSIIVEANGIIIDGAGHVLEGSESKNGLTALNLTAANVTVQNLQVRNWEVGILGAWNNNTITNSTLTDNNKGIAVYGNDYVIRQNAIVNCSTGLFIDGGAVRPQGDNNLIIQNRITGNSVAFDVLNSDGTTVKENEVADNGCILMLNTDTKNTQFFGNNFINYMQVLRIPFGGPTVEGVPTFSPAGNWDNGTIGNYWSDYQTKYPQATEAGHSGIGNTPYVIENTIPFSRTYENGTFISGTATLGTAVDNYPLIAPASISTTPSSAPPNPAPSVPEFPAWTILVAVLLAVYSVAMLALKYPASSSRQLKKQAVN